MTERYRAMKEEVYRRLGNRCAACGDGTNILWLDQGEGRNKLRSFALLYAATREPHLFRLLCVHCKLTKRPPKKDDYGWPKWDPFHGEM